MKRIYSRITINGRALPYLTTVEILDTRNSLTNTATITLPNFASRSGVRISDAIALGAPVKIELGYFPYLFTEFEGFVSQVIPDKTTIIYCEDYSYIAKRISVGRDIVQKQTTLRRLIGAVYNGKFITSDSGIGDWKVSKTATVNTVLKELSSKFRIYSYWRGDTLIVGAENDPREKQTKAVSFQQHIPIGESDFNFKQAEADRIIVKGTFVRRNGTLLEVYAYYEGTPARIVVSRVAPAFGGNINEFNINGQSNFTFAQMSELVSRRLEALSYTGLEGGITIYGSPRFTHGDVVAIQNRDVPDKSGVFSVVEVVKRFGRGIGYRQDLRLGISV